MQAPSDSPHLLVPGVHIVDTGFVRPGMAAAYLVRGARAAAIVETGTARSVPRLLAALAKAGVPREEVAYVVVTHVHLDHAGGAGALLRELPAAKLVVHPRGARHMIDPTKLIAGAAEVYGAEVLQRVYGDIVPVAAERVIEANDGLQIDVGGRSLIFFDAPGHALHHVVILDEASRGFFTGDTFGLAYRELETDRGPFLFPTTTPVQFDPVALHASIERMVSSRPERMYLTHYGMVAGDISRLAAVLHRRIDAHVEIARSAAGAADRHAALRRGILDLVARELEQHGLRLAPAEVRARWEVDVELNAQGLAVWLDKQSRPPKAS